MATSNSNPNYHIFDTTTEVDDEAKWYVPHECLQKLGQFIIGQRIGSGSFGKVFDFCTSELACDKVIKLIPFGPVGHDMKYDMGNFQMEVKITRMASNLGISPKFYDAFTCQGIRTELMSKRRETIVMGFIIQDKWDMSFENYTDIAPRRQLPDDMQQILDTKIETMHENGIAHGDIAPRNVVLRLKPTRTTQDSPDPKRVRRDVVELVPVDLALIDFGDAILEDEVDSDLFEEIVQQDNYDSYSL